jgi:hypothetical protein
MRKPLVLSAAAMASATLLGQGCNPAVTCGTGTRLDEASQTCVAVAQPPLNVIIDDFSLGDFSFTEVDVPEQMQPGFPEQRSFTITNDAEEAQTVTLVRLSLVPVDETIDELRDAIDLIGAEPACADDTECPTTTFCDQAIGVCRLDPIPIGSVIIENLAAGESRPITYDLALPSYFSEAQEGLYGLMFSVNEVALVATTDADGNTTYLEDPEHPIGLENPLERAAALFGAATVIVGETDKPNLRVLYADVDNNAFDSAPRAQPIFTVSARLSAQGKDITSTVRSRFELKLPGHAISVAGQDLGEAYFAERGLNYENAPETTTFIYDADRTFNLLIDAGNDGSTQEAAEWQPQCTNADCTTQVTVENDLGRDGSFDLRLSPFDQRLLSMTTALRSLNQDITANDEITGQLRMVVSLCQQQEASFDDQNGNGVRDENEALIEGGCLESDDDEYQVNGAELSADNVWTADVQFLAPPAGRDADDADSEIPEVEDEQVIPNAAAPGPYAEVDNLTPTWTWSVGNEWVGANAQILNRTTKQRYKGAVVSQDVLTDNFARLNAIKNTIDIVALTGNVEWGTQRTMTQNKASGRLVLMGVTYLDINFQPGVQCSIEDNFETCMVLSAEFRPRKNEGAPTRTPRQKKRTYLNYERGRKFFFAIGPLPFEIEISVSAGLGMRATLAFVQDRSANDADGTAVTTGLQVTAGPVLDAGGSVFGGLSLGLVRVGVRGAVTFASVEFQPAVLVGWTQEIDEKGNNNADDDCWKMNTGQIRWEGPLTVSVLSGDISVVAEGGICGCLPWIGCACAWGQIFSFTIVRIPPAWTNTWMLFQSTYDFANGPGMCTPPPATGLGVGATWNSPRVAGCNDWSGAASYCNNANGTGNYAADFSRTANTCGTLVINGQTENAFDFLTVLDANGNQLIRESGTFSNRRVSVCANGTGRSASVRLNTDGSVIASGVSVRQE